MNINQKSLLILTLLGLSFFGNCQTFYSSSFNEYPFRLPIKLDGEHKNHELQTKIQIETISVNEEVYIMGGKYGEWKISINDSAFCKIYMKLDSDAYGNANYWDGYGYYIEYVLDSNCRHVYRPEIIKFKDSLLIVDIENESVILYKNLK